MLNSINDLISLVSSSLTGQTASIRDTGIPEEQVFILKSAKIIASVSKNRKLHGGFIS